MTTEVAARPLTVRAAMRARREAFDTVRELLEGYRLARIGPDVTAASRARAACCLAILVWIEAVADEAAAEDRQDPVCAAQASRNRKVFEIAGPSSAQCAQAWGRYQDARSNGDRTAITAARRDWRAAFVGGFEEMAARWVAHDQEHADRLRRRIDDLGEQLQRKRN